MSSEPDIAATLSWFGEEPAEVTAWPPPPGPASRVTGEPTSVLPARYIDLGHLALGGMSQLRRVRDTVLGAELAMKLLAWRFVKDERNRSLFLAEAQATAQLQHPGIVAVQDCGELPDGRLWFTMSIVRGTTLDEVAADVRGSLTGRSTLHGGLGTLGSRWTLRRLLGVLQQVCEIVAFAHSEGAVHRDLKPSNIMIGRFGEVRVMDWGLATLPGVDHPLVESGLVVGTPAYMSPEQARGMPCTQASDVYALGGMLYRLLSGEHPRSGHVRYVVKQAASGRSPRLPEDDPGIPGPLRELCHRCLTRDPSVRPTAAELAESIEAWLEGAQRRREALKLVDEVRAEKPIIEDLNARALQLRAEATRLLEAVSDEDPAEAKKPAWELEDRAGALESEATLREVTWTQRLRAALTRAPDLPEAHELLADHYRARLELAEATRDRLAIARFEALLRDHDQGRHAAYLRGDGALTLRTTRPVFARLHRMVEQDRRLVPVFERDLGHAPFDRIRVGRGSWLLTLHADDGVEVRYPVLIERGQHWNGVAPDEAEPTPIWIPAQGDLGPDDRYVPAGYSIIGGDPEAADGLPRQRVWVDGFVLSRFPVTLQAWRDFVQELVDAGDQDAVELCWPRTRLATPFLVRDQERVEISSTYDPTQPVTGVCFAAAALYAARRGRRLPTGVEIEKAGRGVDGRFTPWGDVEETRWSRVARSLPRPAALISVHAFRTDESVYGVRGLAGNARTWCGNWWSPEGPIRDGRATGGPEHGTHREVRGGTFNGPGTLQRTAQRFGDPAESRFDILGLRLAADLPG